MPWKKPNPCAWPRPHVGNGPGKDKMWLLRCLSHQSQTCLFVPLPEQDLGSQEEIWLKAFRGLCRLCPAMADGFFPWEGPSPPPSDARGVQNSSILHRYYLETHWQGPLLSPRGVGIPPGAATTAWSPQLAKPGSGTAGTAGACAQEGGELTGLIFSRLHSALTCDPRYRKDAANASSPRAGWLDLVGRGKSTSRLFRPAGVASNSNLISP